MRLKQGEKPLRNYFPTALKPRVTMGEGLKLVANSSSPCRYPVWCGFRETTRWVSSPGFSTFLGWRTIESCESFDFTFRIVTVSEVTFLSRKVFVEAESTFTL